MANQIDVRFTERVIGGYTQLGSFHVYVGESRRGLVVLGIGIVQQPMTELAGSSDPMSYGPAESGVPNPGMFGSRAGRGSSRRRRR